MIGCGWRLEFFNVVSVVAHHQYPSLAASLAAALQALGHPGSLLVLAEPSILPDSRSSAGGLRVDDEGWCGDGGGGNACGGDPWSASVYGVLE